MSLPVVKRNPKTGLTTISSGGQAIFGLTDEAAVAISVDLKQLLLKDICNPAEEQAQS